MELVKDIILIIGANIPNFFYLWKHFSERKKIDPQVRLIRNKAKQDKVKVQRDAELTKLKIEEAAIREEVKHLARIRGIEMGIASENQKEASTDLNFLSNLKKQATDLVQDKVGSVTDNLSNKVDVNKLADLLGKKDKKQ